MAAADPLRLWPMAPPILHPLAALEEFASIHRHPFTSSSKVYQEITMIDNNNNIINIMDMGH